VRTYDISTYSQHDQKNTSHFLLIFKNETQYGHKGSKKPVYKNFLDFGARFHDLDIFKMSKTVFRKNKYFQKCEKTTLLQYCRKNVEKNLKVDVGAYFF